MFQKALMVVLALSLCISGFGCGDDEGAKLEGLGEACGDGADCDSGFCNGGVCSQCESDADCAGEATCVDNTSGVGYFVCQTGDLGALGDTCAAGDECNSGFCNGGVCSECEQDSDCPGGGTCVDDTAGSGYFVCQGGLGALGDDCNDGSECESGFCQGNVCSECEQDSDCGAQEACTDDTAGVGYFVCQSTLAGLGEACSEGGECASGFCNGGVCSECEQDSDCPGVGTCIDDTAGVGYFVCQGGLGVLGDDCSDGSECLSGFCAGSVCSECEVDGDCPGGQTCIDDTAGVGYFVCQESGPGNLGDDCTVGDDCASGFCYNQVCSECEYNGDCDVLQDCIWDGDLGYAVCQGTGELGDSCSHGGQCMSGFCTGSVCSECGVDADCPGGGTCLDDTAGVGYYVCSGGYGDDCVDGGDCGSGFCNGGVCSECELDTDCADLQECQYDQQAGYAVCVGIGVLGDACDSADQCASGFCTGSFCSECGQDSDCGETGACVDDTAGVGYFVCLLGLGEVCQDNGDCASGFCFNPPGPGAWVCSECAQDTDCDTQQACEMNPDLDYGTCVGTGALGDDCTSADQCASGFCTGEVCSQCGVDADCPGGGTCTDDTAGAGYYLCTGGLGENCADGSECNSGYCFDRPWGGSVCSECEVDADCADLQECLYSQQDGYASCVGTLGLGDDCTAGTECESGFCNNLRCSECESDADCSDGGFCLDDTADSGYYVCSGGLGDDCTDGTDCTSGFCFDPPGPNNPVCSLCEQDTDCPAGQECLYNWMLQYGECQTP